MDLSVERFEKNGFYLVLPSDRLLFFSKEVIGAYAREFLDDPSRISPHLRRAIEQTPCTVCPMKDAGQFCHALFPTLPVLDAVDEHMSYDAAAAVYRTSGDRSVLVAIRQTTMQEALRYVSILSLVHYCEVGQKYREWFFGVTPVMSFDEVVNRLYLNVFWLCRGDRKKAKQLIETFSHEIRITVLCQSERLLRICKRDAFVNAFSATHLITHLLSRCTDEALKKAFTTAGDEGAVEPHAT